MNEVNDVLLERAKEAMAHFEGTILEDAIAKAIADKDLEHLNFMVSHAEAEISRQEFFNNDILGDNDDY